MGEGRGKFGAHMWGLAMEMPGLGEWECLGGDAIGTGLRCMNARQPLTSYFLLPCCGCAACVLAVAWQFRSRVWIVGILQLWGAVGLSYSWLCGEAHSTIIAYEGYF